MIDVLEENRGKLRDAGFANGFLAMGSRKQADKGEKVNETVSLEMEMFCHQKHKQKKCKRPNQMRARQILDQALISRLDEGYLQGKHKTHRVALEMVERLE